MATSPTPVSAGPPSWLVPVLVVGLAVGAVSACIGHPDLVIGDGVDLFGTFWFYWFIGDCIEHLRDPSFTDLMFHPLGKEIFAHTGNNFVDAVAAQPFRLLFGFPRYQPVFVGFLLLVNGLTFMPLAKRVLGARSWAMVLAVALWTVNPFVLFECMAGRFTQATLWFAPTAFLGMLQLGDNDRELWKDALLAGVFTALQAWTYWFMGLFMALAFAWLAAVRLLWPEGRSRKRMLLGWLMAAAICAVLVAPGGVSMAMAATSGAVPGLVEGDVTSVFAMPKGHASNLPKTLHGAVLMERHGQPQITTLTWMVLIPLMAVAGLKRRLWLGMAGLLAVFAVGPAWPLESGQTMSMPAYLFLYNVVPFVNRLWFPYRMMAVCFLALSIGAGTVLLRLERIVGGRSGAAWRLLPPVVLVMVLGGALIEQHHNLAFPLVTRSLPVPAAYTEIGKRGGAIIELPIGMARISIAYQPVHEQPVFGGMAENAPLFWPEGYREKQLNNRFARFLFSAVDNPVGEPVAFDPHHLLRLRGQGFRWVVLDRHYVDANVHRTALRLQESKVRDQAPFLVQDRITEALGAPVGMDGSLLVWDLSGWTDQGLGAPTGEPWPAGLQGDAESLRTRSWPREDMPAYERHMRERGRIVN